VTRADNSHHLQRAALARHEAAVDRARQAIEELDRNSSVTFAAVAAAARVSRSWLYTQVSLRDAIIGRRRARPAPASPAAQRATTDSMIKRLDHARAEIARLRAENTDLHTKLARALGEHRTGR
jgi:AraC-like DNA-binding protein